VLNGLNPPAVVVALQRVEDPEAELDERWSDVQSNEQQRWLWHAIAPNTGKVLADTLGDHQDEVFLKLQALLEPCGIARCYTDDGGPMNATCHPLSIRSVKRIPTRLHGNTSPYGPVLKDE